MQQYKQVGNAVPISLGYAVGELIKKLIQKEEVVNFSDFKYSRYKNTTCQDWEKDFAKRRVTSIGKN